MKLSLILNPGSTSTKLGVFSGLEPVLQETISHSQEELAQFDSVYAQRDYRESGIRALLAQKGIAMKGFGAIVAIGGLIRPGPAGVYRVNAAMLRDLEIGRYDEHASNLGAVIGAKLGAELEIPAYVADAVTADEMMEIARLSGLPEINRLGRSHTLNQKYMARRAATALGKPYEEAAIVVAHLGGGISVTAHLAGRMVDTNAARGEGPFCIDRAGGVNAFELAKLCYSGQYPREILFRKLNGNGGVVAYLGTRDFREVERQMDGGSELAWVVFHAMAYQIAKEIAAMTVALEGQTDAIVLTGGMAHSHRFIHEISRYVAHLGRVLVYPGEGEMEAMAGYAAAILDGHLTPIEY